MPYICLAQDLPDGTVQVLDLVPNSSQRSLIYDPEGQTRYVNRAVNEIPQPTPTGTLAWDANGLSAYLADRVESGGLEYATGSITMSTVGLGDTVDIKGVTFTGIAAPRGAGSQDFNTAVSDNDAAAELTAAINDAASQALLTAAAPVGVVVAAVNTGAPSPLVDLTASVVGPDGDAVTLAKTGGIVLSGATLTRANSSWTMSTLDTASAALLARVDAGSTMQLADVNTILGAVDAELTSAGGSNSTGTLADLLSVLAGRGYRLPAGSLKLTGGVWSAAQAGAFTTNVTVFGTTWQHGEIRPAAIAGDTETRETKGIRHTYDGTSFQISVGAGHLLTFQSGVTLYPDSDLSDHYPWLTQSPPLMQGTNSFPETAAARVVTVYNDDGTLA